MLLCWRVCLLACLLACLFVNVFVCFCVCVHDCVLDCALYWSSGCFIRVLVPLHVRLLGCVLVWLCVVCLFS